MELNFVGLSVFDFRRCLDFYTGVLGMDAEVNTETDWALLGKSWAMHRKLKNPGMMVEMFQVEAAQTENRYWGWGQNIRPSIQVGDLAAASEKLRKQGVRFTSGLRKLPWGDFIEFTSPESVSWTLSHLHEIPGKDDLHHPCIALVELKVKDIDAQKEFYIEVMGIDVREENGSQFLLEQGNSRVFLSLEEGAGEFPYITTHSHSPVLSRPVWISFETSDVRSVAEEMRRSGIPVAREIRFHPEWRGTDIIVIDPDGNPLQIVQFDIA